jgi:ABC-type branched-subunit amino acid transport system ATPase component
MRIAQMWTDFQQTGISMDRLGDILNTRTELPPKSASPLPRVQGRVTLEDVTFRYRPDTAPVLHAVNLNVQPGQVIGIVGRSGSGKSTLTKLIQRLYVPEAGHIRVDGQDIALIDAAQLRRQVGVVLQENMLFNRSVRENIAIADPAAPLEAEKNRLKAAMVAHVRAVEDANRRAFEENARKAAEAEAELARTQESVNPFDEPNPFDDVPPVTPVEVAPVQEVQVHRAMSSVTKAWEFRIVNADAVPRQYCQPDERIIRAAVAGGCREIAGVEIYEETKVASR